MRFLSLFVLPLVALPLAPAEAQRLEAPSEAVAKIALAHLDARRFIDTLHMLPAGIDGVYAMPHEDALIVRGSLSAISEMRAAVKVADAPLQGRLVITLQHASPEAIRTAALALPQAGTVALHDKTLQFQGRPDWLLQVRGLVFGAELTHPQPLRSRQGTEGTPKQHSIVPP